MFDKEKPSVKFNEPCENQVAFHRFVLFAFPIFYLTAALKSSLNERMIFQKDDAHVKAFTLQKSGTVQIVHSGPVNPRAFLISYQIPHPFKEEALVKVFRFP